MSARALFFLRHYNDIDHIVPIIWRWLEEGNEATVVLLDPSYDADGDPRLAFVEPSERLTLTTVQKFLDVPLARQLFDLDEDRSLDRFVERFVRPGLRRAGLTVRRARDAIASVDPDVCVFEWSSPLGANKGEFFLAAERLGVPTVCVPHGLNIYTHPDIHPWRERVVEEGRQPFTDRNRYDVYVTQSEYHKQQDVGFGIDADRMHVLGSARYCPEWQEVNLGLHDPFEAGAETGDRTRVVFMLPHWKYFVDEAATQGLLVSLARHEDVHLIVKSHTRDATGLTADVRREFRERADTVIVADVPSVSLIEWSDAVVNFGSSIGIEVLLQDRHHVNPTYLHENRTIFDETGASLRATSETGVMETIERVHAGSVEGVSEDAKAELYETVVYGGREPHDVIGEYVALLDESEASGH